jgi:hypothetical protein
MSKHIATDDKDARMTHPKELRMTYHPFSVKSSNKWPKRPMKRLRGFL